jgi:hypothetical protein
MSEKSQTITHGIRTVVRLHTLDNCERLVGNPGKFSGEFILGNRGRAAVRSFHPERELAVLGPFWVHGGDTPIQLNDIERQVIEGGSHLVDHFAGEDGDFSRRRLGNIQLPFATSLLDDFVGPTRRVNGYASLDGA